MGLSGILQEKIGKYRGEVRDLQSHGRLEVNVRKIVRSALSEVICRMDRYESRQKDIERQLEDHVKALGVLSVRGMLNNGRVSPPLVPRQNPHETIKTL